MPNAVTTREAARVAGITRATLQDWIRVGKVVAPEPILRGAIGMRLWTEIDISRLLEVKSRIYRRGEGRGRKRKTIGIDTGRAGADDTRAPLT